MTNAKTTTSKKDQIKTAIMNFLNDSIGSVGRKEIDEKVKELGSSRTISRALAELKTSGQALQQKDDKVISWISTEPKTKTEASSPALKEAGKIADEIKKDRKETPPIQKAGEIADKIRKDTKKSTAKPTDEHAPAEKAVKDATVKAKKDAAPKKKAPAKPAHEVAEEVATAADKKEKAKKKELTKDNLVKAAKSKVTRNTAPAKAKDKKPAGPKKPGVIATIIKAISKKPRTKKQILKVLVKAFPDREADKMAKTISVQVPSRLKKDKGLKITKSEKGYLIEK